MRSRVAGTFVVSRPQDLPGRFLREGQQIGYVLPPSSRIVARDDSQDDIELVRTGSRARRVRLAERPGETLRRRSCARCRRGSDELPSKALGEAGGGAPAGRPARPTGPQDAAARVPGRPRAAGRTCRDRSLRQPRLRALRPRLGADRPASLATRAAAAAVAASSLTSPHADHAHRLRLDARRSRPQRLARRPTRKESRLDRCLLGAWGRISPWHAGRRCSAAAAHSLQRRASRERARDLSEVALRAAADELRAAARATAWRPGCGAGLCA